ncbi:hypothetical protein [Streptomyces sp. NPDC001165]|uniref:hypothetical protein n=1 Tax=Streptomyces sp. NPDC001165 TaxID=3364546 RepID=UPI0036BD0346
MHALLAHGLPGLFRAVQEADSQRLCTAILACTKASTALTTQPPDDSPSSVMRPLTAQLAELKRQHRDEVQALEAAQSENLELRRRLGPRHTARPGL